MARKTQQRAAIRKALEDADRPLSAVEVLAAAQQHVPGLGIATVYRNLKTFVDEAFLKTVELPGDPNRYELASRQTNHYFRCNNTKRVYRLNIELPDMTPFIPEGSTLESHMVLLEGTGPRL